MLDAVFAECIDAEFIVAETNVTVYIVARSFVTWPTVAGYIVEESFMQCPLLRSP